MKKFLATIVTVAMLFGMCPAVLAQLEYEAEFSILGTAVGFENEPYSDGKTVYVPLEEMCSYLKLSVTKDGEYYTVVRNERTAVIRTENMVCTANGAEVVLSAHPLYKNGLLYVPGDFFEVCLGIPASKSADGRSMDITPNVYTIDIDENHAAAVSGASPDADTLAIGETASDTLFEPGAKYDKALQKSVYYLIDLADVSGLDISEVNLGLYLGKGGNNNPPSINVVRTAVWEKGSISYNNKPTEYTSEITSSISLGSDYATNMKNFKYNSFDITSLVENALKEGSKLSVKVQAFPYSGLSSAPNTTQAAVRGVNTQYAPKVYVTTEESFTFPVKENDLKMSNASDYDDIKLLASLGIVTTDDEFPMNLTEAKISRGDFVKLAMRLKNDHRNGGSDAQHFSDVPVDNEYFKAVADAYAEGIVTGEQGTSFRPYDAITVNEACAIIGRILGYEEYAIRNGGYAQGYIKAATRVSLLSGAKNENGVLTYQGAARMLVNALDAPMFVANVFSSNTTVEYIFDESTTVLTEYFDAKEIKGTVTANEYSYISGTLAGSNHIAIDGKKLSLRYEGYRDFLGYDVKAYYNNENELLYMGIKDGSIDTIDLSKVVSVSQENGITIKYEENGDTKSISFLKNDVIYNGMVVTSNNVTTDMFDVDGGELVKLSNGRVIVKAYTDMVAYAVNCDDEVISDKYEPYDKAVRLANTNYYSITDTDGSDMALEDIKTGSVLSVAKSKDGRIVNIIVSSKIITGTIQSVIDGGTDEEVLEIAGLSYKTANRNKAWTDKLIVGKSGTFYIDAFGKICDFVGGEQENIVGYMIAMDYASNSGISKKLQAAIMIGTSEKYVLYNLADKVKINGTPEKDHSVIRGMFYPEGSFVQQAVLFSTNGNGEINKINTAVDATVALDAETLKSITDETLVKSSSGTALYHRATSQRLGDRFYFNMSEKPAVAVPSIKTALDDYEIVSGSIKNGDITADVYTFGIDTPVAEMIVLENYETTAMAGSTIFCVLQKKIRKITEDGDYVLALCCITDPGVVETIIVPNDKESAVSAIAPGDVITLRKNNKGEFYSVTVCYDESEATITGNGETVKSSFRIYGGYAVGKKDKYVKLTSNKANLNSTDPSKFQWIDLVTAGSLYKVIKEGNSVEVEKATIDDVIDYNTVPYAPSGLVIYTRYSTMGKTFIVEVDQPENTGIYKAEFVGNGETGGNAPAFMRVNIGDTITIPDSGTLTKDEYRFVGWKLQGDTSGTIYKKDDPTYGTYKITSESTIFEAVWEWEGRQYQITFAGGDGASGESFVKTTSDINPGLMMPTTDDGGVPRFTKPGYIYRVWTDGVNDYTPGETYSITSQITITPKWIECWDGVSTFEPEIVSRDGQEYYKITNGAELAWFAKNADMASNAYLANDIRLNLDGEYVNNWASWQIGSSDVPFKGIFDGNGKKIINYYYESGAAYSGMFHTIKGGSVKNLTFENAKFVSAAAATTSTYSAIVCGYATDATFDSITVSGSAYAAEGKYMNCFGAITGYSIKGDSYVRINNCVNNMSIDASAATTALESTNNSGLGGIAGCVRSGTKITNCTNNGTINAPKTSRVGGIVGNLRSADGGTAVDNCTNTADITGYSVAGLICGYTKVTPVNCSESGTLTVK